MRSLRAFFAGADEGQALVLIAITLLGTLMAVGLAVDSGQLFNGRRTAQEAADAAAFAGATALYQGGTATQAATAAGDDAALNGFATDLPTAGTKVTVSAPPVSGPFIGNPLYVEVVITTFVRTTLVPQQAGVATIRARGVAGNITRANPYAVVALDQTCTVGTISVAANGTLAVTGGGIKLNSCSATAGTRTGSGVVSLGAGLFTDVVGNISDTWPSVRAGQPVFADPLAGLARPSTNGLPTNAPACAPTINQPGIYTSSISTNCSYVFAPGVYILKGAGVNLSGNASWCTGPSCTPATAAGGVMFFLTNANYPAAGGACGTFSLQGNAASTLSGLTSGTYLGMLLWQDGVCTAALTFGGQGEIDATNGTIYAPTATVRANGNNADVKVSQIIAKRLDVSTGEFEVTFTNSLTYQGPIPALVE